MTVADELKELIDEVLSDDPRTALIALRRLSDDELPWIEQKVVALARHSDWNWARIGRLLGRSRWSVRERFDNVRLATRSPRQTYTSGVEREFRDEAAEIARRRAYERDADPVAW